MILYTAGLSQAYGNISLTDPITLKKKKQLEKAKL